MWLVKKWKEFANTFKTGPNGKKLQEEIDALNAAYFTSYYKVFNSIIASHIQTNVKQANLLNSDPHYKFQDMASHEELEKLAYVKPSKLKLMADENIAGN
jgi:hypothetical protein